MKGINGKNYIINDYLKNKLSNTNVIMEHHTVIDICEARNLINVLKYCFNEDVRTITLQQLYNLVDPDIYTAYNNRPKAKHNMH
jgi:hypothetical protein